MSLDLAAINDIVQTVDARIASLEAFAEKAMELAQSHKAAATEGAQAVAALSQVSDHLKGAVAAIDEWLAAHQPTLDAMTQE